MSWIECHFHAKSMNMNTSVNVLLPEDIQPGEKLKVLYLLHGYIGDHTDWMRFSSIERYVEDYRLAVVMPSVHNSYYTDMVYGMAYFTYVSEELPLWIEQTFPVSNKREDRYVAGLSMGGYGAFKMAFSKPEMYSKAASLSGALDIVGIRSRSITNQRFSQYEASFGKESLVGTSSDLKYLVSKLKKNNQIMPDLYLACGTEDFVFDDFIQFKSHLDQLGITYRSESSMGDHNWVFWDAYIVRVLAWLFEK